MHLALIMFQAFSALLKYLPFYVASLFSFFFTCIFVLFAYDCKNRPHQQWASSILLAIMFNGTLIINYHGSVYQDQERTPSSSDQRYLARCCFCSFCDCLFTSSFSSFLPDFIINIFSPIFVFVYFYLSVIKYGVGFLVICQDPTSCWIAVTFYGHIA